MYAEWWAGTRKEREEVSKQHTAPNWPQNSIHPVNIKTDKVPRHHPLEQKDLNFRIIGAKSLKNSCHELRNALKIIHQLNAGKQ